MLAETLSIDVTWLVNGVLCYADRFDHRTADAVCPPQLVFPAACQEAKLRQANHIAFVESTIGDGQGLGDAHMEA